jgi:CSLREA domain-containing protein
MMEDKVRMIRLWKIVIKAGLSGVIVLGASFTSAVHFTRAAQPTFISVNTFKDEMAVDGNCSLREAIRAANLDTAVDACPAGSGADTVYLPAGIYTLSIAGAGEDNGLTGDLDILSDLTITGSGEGATIVDGGGLDRVFHIVVTPQVTYRVKIANLTIRNGSVKTAGFYGGGGILNQGGNLDVERVVLQTNHAANTGGGIDNHNNLKVDQVTFYKNTAAVGGGLFNDAQLSVFNSTFNQNSADRTGGGLDNNNDGTTINNSTFSGNTANQGGGGIFTDSQMDLLNLSMIGNNTGLTNNYTIGIRIKNTIIAMSTSGNDCTGSGTFTSAGNNIDSDSGNSCNFKLSSDQHGVNPQVEALADNGGPTLTHALKAGSPAIDHGDNTDCPKTDQRGAFRPADGDGDKVAICDIGAVEFNASFPKSVNLPLLLR